MVALCKPGAAGLTTAASKNTWVVDSGPTHPSGRGGSWREQHRAFGDELSRESVASLKVFRVVRLAGRRHVTVTLYYYPRVIMAAPIFGDAGMFDTISSDAIFAVLVAVDVVAIIGLAAIFLWPRRWLGRLKPQASRGR